MKNSPTPPQASLFLVSTPIGNLADITLRALDTLNHVSVIAAEDTRQTQKLLRHYDIQTPMTSYHDHNKEEKARVLLQKLAEGNSIALVTDAGTPCIADPGYYLINRSIAAGIPVIPIPGPAAFLAALSASGLPTDAFIFEGFLPKKKAARIRHFESLADEERTMVWYESPHRIVRTLSDIQSVFGDRRVVVAREMTKKFEECLRGPVSEVISRLEKKTVRGEITLVVEGGKNVSRIWE